MFSEIFNSDVTQLEHVKPSTGMGDNYTVPIPTERDYKPEIQPEIHYVVGSILLAVGTAGVLGNALVLFVFTRFRRLRGPFSSFIVNLAISDLCTSLLHSMAIVSSFRRHWAFGRLGCMLYAGGVGHFGLLSIVTLAAIAVERYWVITAKPLSGSRKMTKYCARKVCVMAWVYCLAMSLPPFFGWSRYVPEGFHTSCSWDYTTRTVANRAYYIYLLTFGFLIPVAVITFCYTFIMIAILAHGREMKDVKANGGGKQRSYISSRLTVPNAPSSSTVRTAEIILVLVLFFMISWTPYAVITFIGQFGDRRWLTPWVTALPAIFAKGSVVYNPIIYGLSHPHFRSSVKQYISACTTGGSSTLTMAGSQKDGAGKRSNPLQRALTSSPASTPGHHTHFRCFPRHVIGEHSYHSEPDTRRLSILLERPLVKLEWQDGKKGQARVLSTVVSAPCYPPCNSNAITSENMVTTGSQTSTKMPLKLYDLEYMTNRRRSLIFNKR